MLDAVFTLALIGILLLLIAVRRYWIPKPIRPVAGFRVYGYFYDYIVLFHPPTVISTGPQSSVCVQPYENPAIFAAENEYEKLATIGEFAPCRYVEPYHQLGRDHRTLTESEEEIAREIVASVRS